MFVTNRWLKKKNQCSLQQNLLSWSSKSSFSFRQSRPFGGRRWWRAWPLMSVPTCKHRSKRMIKRKDPSSRPWTGRLVRKVQTSRADNEEPVIAKSTRRVRGAARPVHALEMWDCHQAAFAITWLLPLSFRRLQKAAAVINSGSGGPGFTNFSSYLSVRILLQLKSPFDLEVIRVEDLHPHCWNVSGCFLTQKVLWCLCSSYFDVFTVFEQKVLSWLWYVDHRGWTLD